MENLTKICENTIEEVKFELFTNNNKHSYQTLKLSMEGATRTTNRIAPVDFYTFTTAIMCEERLCDWIDAVGGTWAGNWIGDLVDELVDENEGVI